MRNVLQCAFLATVTLAMASQAFALPCPPGNPPTNCAPPLGAILDLDGTPIPHNYTQYSINFVATANSTNISFAFREDPAFLFLDDVSVAAGVGPNLLLNGGFELGPSGSSAPTDWTYLNSFGASFGGVVDGINPHSGSLSYDDGAVQAYDGITQAVATTVGTTYTISFWLDDNSGLTTFSRLSTNGDVSDTGGNGADLLVYAGAVPILATPEPASIELLGVGLLAVAGCLRRKKLI